MKPYAVAFHALLLFGCAPHAQPLGFQPALPTPDPVVAAIDDELVRLESEYARVRQVTCPEPTTLECAEARAIESGAIEKAARELHMRLLGWPRPDIDRQSRTLQLSSAAANLRRWSEHHASEVRRAVAAEEFQRESERRAAKLREEQERRQAEFKQQQEEVEVRLAEEHREAAQRAAQYERDEQQQEERRRQAILDSRLPDSSKKAILERRVLPGMGQAEVLMSWGWPSRVEKTVTAAGTSELWLYDNGSVLFERDKATVIKTTR